MQELAGGYEGKGREGRRRDSKSGILGAGESRGISGYPEDHRLSDCDRASAVTAQDCTLLHQLAGPESGQRGQSRP
jgi:hypothetical protein